MKIKLVFLAAMFLSLGVLGSGVSQAGGGDGRDGVVCEANDPSCENFTVPNEQIVPPVCTAGQEGSVGRLSGDSFVNVRSGPGKSHSIIGKLNEGETFSVKDVVEGENVVDGDLDDSSSSWLVIDYKGKKGYISSLYGLCDSVITDPIDDPIDSGNPIDPINDGSMNTGYIEPIDQNGVRPGQVIDNTDSPFPIDNTNTPDPVDPGIDNPPVGNDSSCQEYKITNLSGDTHVRLRSKPTRQSSVLGTIPDEAIVEFIAKVDGEEVFDSDLNIAENPSSTWLNVTYNGVTGFISSLYAVPSCVTSGPTNDNSIPPANDGDFTVPNIPENAYVDCDANPDQPECTVDGGFVID